MIDAGASGVEPTDRFLHLSDLHFWEVVLNPLRMLNKRMLGNINVVLRRRREFLTGEASRFVDDLSAFGVKDLIVTGDFTSTATGEEFRLAAAFVRDLVKHYRTVYVIPGNHDVYTFEAVRARRFERFMGAWMPAETLPAMRRLPGGTPVVFVPTVCPNVLNSRGNISSAEIALVRELLEPLASPVVVAGHYPVLDATYGYATTRHRNLRNAQELRRALGESGKRILYICGHVHRFSHVRDETYPNLTHLTTGALFRRDHDSGRAGDLSEVRVVGDDFTVLRRRCAGAWSLEEAPPR